MDFQCRFQKLLKLSVLLQPSHLSAVCSGVSTLLQALRQWEGLEHFTLYRYRPCIHLAQLQHQWIERLEIKNSALSMTMSINRSDLHHK